jgi:hypothetical protein
MRHLLRTALGLALAALGLPASASAQADGGLPRALSLPVSARAMALGDAYMMNAGDAEGIFYHPSLLAGSSGFDLEVQRWGDAGSAVSASAAGAWFGGGVGLGLVTLQYGAGAGPTPAGQDDLFIMGPAPVSERIALLGFGREVLGVDVGVAAKLVEERVGDARDAAAAFDVGASSELGPLTVGVTAHDLGPSPFDENGGNGPSRVVVGAGAYGQELGIFDIGASATAAFSEDDSSFGGGIEIGYWPVRGRTFVARVGLREVPEASDASPVTMGFSYWGDSLVLEWAYQPVDGAPEGGTHRFGIGWR